MKTKSLSIFLVALFVVGMNLGAEEDKNENKKGENFEYEKMKEDDINKFDFKLKTVLIGNSNVGKSPLALKICKDNFSEDDNVTIGYAFFNLNFRIVSDEDNPVLKYQICDCCGKEFYRNLVTSFFHNVSVFLLAYYVTNVESFNDINSWVNDVKAKNIDKTIHLVLIGTKIDLNDNRKVTKETGKKFAEENGMKFVEVSAKTGDGIKELENILAKIIYEEFKKDNIYEEFKKNKKKKEKKDENDEKSDFVEYNKSTSSLCDCCEEICDNC